MAADGGLASSDLWRRYGLSYVRAPGTTAEASTAVADAWTPPSPLALPADMCHRLREFAVVHCRPQTHDVSMAGSPTTRLGVTAWVLGTCRVHDGPARHRVLSELAPSIPLDADLVDAIVSRLDRANRQWWTLDVDSWTLIVKRYLPGGEHRAHTDWMPDPDSQGRKLSSSIQLSDGAEYEGGDLQLRRANGPGFPPVALPRDRGTVIVFPSWTIHEVTPVEAGERWVLLVNGWGPRLR